MALTPDEENKIRQLLARESEQKQESILASKNNFKRWLEKVADWAIQKLADALIDALFRYFLGG